jgi:hypothetical protein
VLRDPGSKETDATFLVEGLVQPLRTCPRVGDALVGKRVDRLGGELRNEC